MNSITKQTFFFQSLREKIGHTVTSKKVIWHVLHNLTII